MIRKGIRVLATATLVGAGAAVIATPTLAQKVDFTGKRIEIIIPGREGSGNDVYARVFAPFFEKHLPGKPTVINRNIPGSGTIAGANQFQQKAKTDGLMIISVTSSTISNYTLKHPGVRYKMESWIPIILSPQGSVFYVASTLGVLGSMSRRYARSSVSHSEMAAPPLPARPVRPMRCTYVSGTLGSSKLMTCVMSSTSMPRAAMSVATST